MMHALLQAHAHAHAHARVCTHMHMSHARAHAHVYYLQAELAGLFKDNFAKYASECTPEVVACGPKA